LAPKLKISGWVPSTLYFAKILRVEADKLGYPSNFTIYDTDDSKSVLRAILKEMNLDDKLYSVNLVLNRISAAKNNLYHGANMQKNEQIQADDFSSGRGILGKIYETYATTLFPCRCHGF
jgi:DNA helicase-2/ATP-dependent DNA helicase PcrA